MKKVYVMILGVSLSAGASEFPIGSFDCSGGRNRYLVTITDSRVGLPVVDAQVTLERGQSSAKGMAVLAREVNSTTGNELNTIKLSGTNIMLFFDRHGQLGTEPDSRNCIRK